MTNALTPTMSALAARLAQARREGERVSDPSLPADMAQAMAAQAEVVRLLGERRAGWKIAIVPGFGPAAAPLPAGAVLANGAAWRCVQDVGLEVEIALRMGRDLAPGEHRREEIAAAVDGACLGLELVGSRLARGNDPFLPFLADSLANVAYVVGPWRPWLASDEPAGRPCRVRFDGAILFDAPCEEGHGDPLLVLRDGLRTSGALPEGLRAGEIVTTGSRCGVVKAPCGGP
jgi:2-keto-4-pentenoate hydratase